MFIVIEIQKTENDAATLLTKHATKQEAEAQYHRVLAAAAISAVPEHSAAMLTDTGFFVKSERYSHETAPDEA